MWTDISGLKQVETTESVSPEASHVNNISRFFYMSSVSALEDEQPSFLKQQSVSTCSDELGWRRLGRGSDGSRPTEGSAASGSEWETEQGKAAEATAAGQLRSSSAQTEAEGELRRFNWEMCTWAF